MNEITKRISERLAIQSSRRGFFFSAGKAVLGAAALITGQSFFAQSAEASALYCCTGHACTYLSCPSGTHVAYTWYCGRRSFDDHDSDDYIVCHDCYTTSGRFICVYATHHS